MVTNQLYTEVESPFPARILLSKRKASPEVNLLLKRTNTLTSSVSRVGEISSGNISKASIISSQLATDSFIASQCQVLSEIQPQQYQPCSTSKQRVSNSASAEKELAKAPINHLIRMEGTIDMNNIMAREKAVVSGVHQRSPSSLFCPHPIFSPGELVLIIIVKEGGRGWGEREKERNLAVIWVNVRC